MIVVSDVTISLILLLMVGLVLAHARLRWGDYLTPVSAFVGTNLLSMSAYSAGLLELRPLSVKAVLVFGIGLISFAIGSALVSSGRRGGELEERSAGLDKHPQPFLHEFAYGIAIVSNLGWMFLLFRFLSNFSWTEYYRLQHEFQMQYVGYLNLVGILTLPLAVLHTTHLRGRRRVLWLLTGGSLFGLLLSGIKTYFVISVVTALLCYGLARPGRLGIRHYLAIGLLGIGFMGLYDAAIDVFVTSSFMGSRFPEGLKFLERPYLYLAGPVAAMGRIVDSSAEHSQAGQITLHWLWKLLGQGLDITSPVPKTEPPVNIGPRWFNVYSFIGSVYWDWGLGGMVLWLGGLGALTTWAYRLGRAAGQWPIQLGVALLLYGLVISFFLYYYRWNLFFLITVVALFGALPQQLGMHLVFERLRSSKRTAS